MRETWSSLLTGVEDYCRDTDATSITFMGNEINKATRFIYAYLRDYVGRKTGADVTVEDQQYYDLKPDCIALSNVTVTVGSTPYNLIAVDSAKRWNDLNARDVAATTIPQFFYPRRDDFGIWPIPQEDDLVITEEYDYRLKDMSVADYVTGDATFTNDSTAVTGNGTTYTNAMEGRWILGGDGLWYRILTYTSATAIVLDTVYAGETEASVTTRIGESPEIPPELHELIPYRAAEMYFGAYRKDPDQGRFFSNLFWTGDPSMASREKKNAVGGLLGAEERYSSRTGSAIVRRRGRQPLDNWSARMWGYSLS